MQTLDVKLNMQEIMICIRVTVFDETIKQVKYENLYNIFICYLGTCTTSYHKETTLNMNISPFLAQRTKKMSKYQMTDSFQGFIA